MAATIIENPDDPEVETQAGNPAPDDKVSPDTKKSGADGQPKPDTIATEPLKDEPTVEVDGEKIPHSQIKKWKEDFKNDSDWKRKNDERSAQLAAQEREVEQFRVLKPYLEKRPDIIQQLFQPAPQRDFNKEFSDLYTAQPDQFADPQKLQDWSIRRDNLIADKSATEAELRVRQQVEQQYSVTHNNKVEATGRDAYIKTGKVTDGEFLGMTQWIIKNLNPSQGRYPENAYDLAFKACHEDRFLADAKLKATQAVIEPLTGKPGSPGRPGVREERPPASPEDQQDAAFASAVKTKMKGKFQTLPST